MHTSSPPSLLVQIHSDWKLPLPPPPPDYCLPIVLYRDVWHTWRCTSGDGYHKFIVKTEQCQNPKKRGRTWGWRDGAWAVRGGHKQLQGLLSHLVAHQLTGKPPAPRILILTGSNACILDGKQRCCPAQCWSTFLLRGVHRRSLCGYSRGLKSGGERKAAAMHHK